eukprot:7844760-Ditylum_brightwellii.AAC.1
MYNSVLTNLNFQPAWNIIDDDEEVMSHLLFRNKLHLHQALDTLCAKGLIKDYIGEYGISQGEKDVIEGNFDPNVAANLPE